MSVAFLCSGQGSQQVGMGRDLAQHIPSVKQYFDQADEILDFSLSDIIFAGPEDRLRETQFAQPAILTLSVAIGKHLMEVKNLKPSVVAGHSLGEFSALVLAGALEFADAVRLVHFRGQVMQEAVPLGTGTMAAVLGATDEVVEEVCKNISKQDHVVEPANYNCPGQLVISGHIKAVAQACEELKVRGVKKCVALNVSAPFHCSLLKPAGARLSEQLSQVKFKELNIPYVSNVDGEINYDHARIAQKLVDQVWQPVRWTQSLDRLLAAFAPQEVFEVGPGAVLAGHVKKINRELKVQTTDALDFMMS